MSSSSLFPFSEWFESIFLFWSIYLSIYEMEMECDDLSWKKVLTQYSDRLLSFVLNSQLNTLPNPNNLRLWGSAKNLSCGLCGKSDSVTFGHIMGGCSWVLNVENKTTPSEDRYTWRHNNVLGVLCNAIVRKVQQHNQDSQKDTAPGIHFVKEKATASTTSLAKTHTHTHTHKRLSMEILLPQMLGQFSLNFQTQGILNKTLSSRYLPNYKTSFCFCHISKQKDLFCWPRTYSSNWRENSFLEWEKSRKIWEDVSRSWFA